MNFEIKSISSLHADSIFLESIKKDWKHACEKTFHHINKGRDWCVYGYRFSLVASISLLAFMILPQTAMAVSASFIMPYLVPIACSAMVGIFISSCEAYNNLKHESGQPELYVEIKDKNHQKMDEIKNKIREKESEFEDVCLKLSESKNELQRIEQTLRDSRLKSNEKTILSKTELVLENILSDALSDIESEEEYLDPEEAVWAEINEENNHLRSENSRLKTELNEITKKTLDFEKEIVHRSQELMGKI